MPQSKEQYRASSRAWKARNKDRVIQYGRNYVAQNRVSLRHKQLMADYGISYDEYVAMEADQKECCAICGEHKSVCMGLTKTGRQRSLVVDHCHETGKVRGLLCSTCNSAIGFLKDDPELLESAKKYLEQ